MEILSTDTELDITYKLNSLELSVWLKHLNRLKKEINFLEKMITLDVDGQLGDDKVLQQLNSMMKQADTLSSKFKKYQHTKPDQNLCEDFKCDLDILKMHELQRDSYLDYLNEYRLLKNRIHQLLYGRKAVVNIEALKYA